MGAMKKCWVFLIILFGILGFSHALILLAQEPSGEGVVKVSEKHLAMMPCKFVGKKILTEAKFMDVSTTLLDDIYHDLDTRFDSKEYVNFRTIGNGMHHYFIKQSKADIIPTLKVGDRIVISGEVTSCADKNAWIEVDSVAKASTE